MKGSVREKMAVLPAMMILFTQKLVADNNYKKHKVECAFATTDHVCTLGFSMSGRPKSLLKGNEPVSYTHLDGRGNRSGYYGRI